MNKARECLLMLMLVTRRVAVRRFTSSSSRTRRRSISHAASFGSAVIDALQEARANLLLGCGPVEQECRRIAVVLVLGVKAELGLDRGAVDAVAVKTFPGPLGQLHVLLAAVRVDGEGHLEMHAGDNLGIRKLPDVDVVAADDAGEPFDILANLWDADIFRSCLEQDARRGKGQRDRCLENDGSNDKRDGRIGVQLAGPVGQPDDERSNDHTDISQRIANDMKHHGVHTHISVIVATDFRASLSRQSVVVAVVHARIPSCSRFVGDRAGGVGEVRSLGVFEEW